MIAETPTSDVDYLMRVGQVTGQFPAMQRARGTKERADAWVVGLAVYKKGNPEEWTVVADETTGKRANRKIPTACSAFGVKCMGLMGMCADRGREPSPAASAQCRVPFRTEEDSAS